MTVNPHFISSQLLATTELVHVHNVDAHVHNVDAHADAQTIHTHRLLASAELIPCARHVHMHTYVLLAAAFVTLCRGPVRTCSDGGLGPSLLHTLAPRWQATPSFAEREEWMHALNEAACEVSKLFRDVRARAAREKVVHAHSVGRRETGDALKQIREEVTQTL